ncbi:MAG TPA: GFA family protein [Polyangiaceae bacterium]|nr:GFA family protein [Polyangiaceae bacterium]
METKQGGEKKHIGSCHCGAVRFEAVIDTSVGYRCNCSVCTRVASTTSIVKPEAFTLLSGEAELSKYEWGGKTGTRFFCRHCGVTCFSRGYLEEVGGAYASINFNCLEDIDVGEVKLMYWDGRHANWEAGPRNTPWPVFPSE